MSAPGRARRWRVRFDASAFAVDLAHASEAGRKVAGAARQRLEREGIAGEELRACLAESREGTRLAGCVKTYLPPPAGAWGMVFALAIDDDGPYLQHVAFGRRHPPRPWQPSVYQVADRRLRERTE
jgi:hypothetical protein